MTTAKLRYEGLNSIDCPRYTIVHLGLCKVDFFVLLISHLHSQLVISLYLLNAGRIFYTNPQPYWFCAWESDFLIIQRRYWHVLDNVWYAHVFYFHLVFHFFLIYNSQTSLIWFDWGKLQGLDKFQNFFRFFLHKDRYIFIKSESICLITKIYLWISIVFMKL